MKSKKQIGEFRLIKEIGKGNYSIVYLGYWDNDENQKFAIKCIDKKVFLIRWLLIMRFWKIF